MASDGNKRAAYYGKYFSEIDSFYQAFNTACKAALKNGVHHGPTVSQPAGAPMGVQDKNENHLPASWTKFADKFPDYATMLSRSMRSSKLWMALVSRSISQMVCPKLSWGWRCEIIALARCVHLLRIRVWVLSPFCFGGPSMLMTSFTTDTIHEPVQRGTFRDLNPTSRVRAVP